MKKIKGNQGITLIALVITIIILLILAGVTLRYVLIGGIIDNSQRATNTYMGQYNNEINDVNNLSNLIGNYINDSNNPDNPDNPDDDQPATGDETEYPPTPTINEWPPEPSSVPEGGKDKLVPVYDRADLEAVGCGESHMVTQLNQSFQYTTDAIYVLMDDIDLGGSETPWTPISKVLTNAFLGNGHTISNMTITGKQTTKDVGLFAVSSARIENLIMENVNISSISYESGATSTTDSSVSSSNTGAIVGCFVRGRDTYSNYSIINHCAVLSGNISTSSSYTGGLVGYYIDKSTIGEYTLDVKIASSTNKANCTNTNFGGILGGTNSKINIENCTNLSETKVTSGIVGKIQDATVTIYNCINKAEATKAGILGEISGENPIVTINRCENFGNINSADKYKNGISGIVGYAYIEDKGKTYIKNCINNGNISAESYGNGGIFGYISTMGWLDIYKCENNGEISISNTLMESGKSSYLGGIGGLYSGGSINITYCKNNNNVTGSQFDAGIIGGISTGGNVEEINTLNINNCENNGIIQSLTNPSGIISDLSCYENDIVEIKSCINNAYIKALKDSNGASGIIYNCQVGGKNTKLNITSCENNGTIESISYQTGGIIGTIVGSSIEDNKNILISNCKNHKEVTSTTPSSNNARGIGGIIGHLDVVATIEKCENYGKVKGNRNVGGIVGNADGTDKGILIQCKNTGNIICQSGQFVGGICGYATEAWTFKSCINEGTLTSSSIPNPFMGGISGHGPINNEGCINSGEFEYLKIPVENYPDCGKYVHNIVGDPPVD